MDILSDDGFHFVRHWFIAIITRPSSYWPLLTLFPFQFLSKRAVKKKSPLNVSFYWWVFIIISYNNRTPDVQGWCTRTLIRSCNQSERAIESFKQYELDKTYIFPIYEHQFQDKNWVELRRKMSWGVTKWMSHEAIKWLKMIDTPPH